MSLSISDETVPMPKYAPSCMSSFLPGCVHADRVTLPNALIERSTKKYKKRGFLYGVW